MSPRDRRANGKHPGSPPSGVPALFALAVRHHQAGQLFDAENVYRQVLASDSRHFGSLHHLGIIALQKGQAQAAVGGPQRPRFRVLMDSPWIRREACLLPIL